MSKSGLTTATALADSSNYTHGRKGYKICKITPHHMAGVLTGKQCARIFQNPNRNASANYCIGNDGDIVCSVEEENRAWTSSNKENDCQAITIEVSNSSTGGNWPISEKAWNSLVNLCVDICKRYGFRLNYTGDKNGSLTRHNMFANTNCPGPYLQSRFQELADTVNARLDGGQPTPAPSGNKTIDELAHEVIAGKYGNGEARKNALGDKYSAVQARVNEILKGGSTPAPSKKSNETIADEVIKGLWGNGQDRKNRLTVAGYDYGSIQSIVNRKLGAGGSTSNRKSNEEIANEVIQGKWGNGADRKARLQNAGYNYSEIQSIVNKKLLG